MKNKIAKNLSKKLVSSVLLVAVAVPVIGCESNSGTGALIGGGAGAGGGALIGSAVAGKGNRTEGALVGAGIGALAGAGTGYLVGREGDKKEERRRRERDREDRYYQAPPAQQPAQAPAYQGQGQGLAPRPAAQALTPNDVILWHQQGTREDIIIDRIERSGTRFNLNAADENKLRDAGVSEAVIRSMKATAAR